MFDVDAKAFRLCGWVTWLQLEPHICHMLFSSLHFYFECCYYQHDLAYLHLGWRSSRLHSTWLSCYWDYCHLVREDSPRLNPHTERWCHPYHQFASAQMFRSWPVISTLLIPSNMIGGYIVCIWD